MTVSLGKTKMDTVDKVAISASAHLFSSILSRLVNGRLRLQQAFFRDAFFFQNRINLLPMELASEEEPSSLKIELKVETTTPR
jgi:hypothetical protein